MRNHLQEHRGIHQPLRGTSSTAFVSVTGRVYNGRFDKVSDAIRVPRRGLGSGAGLAGFAAAPGPWRSRPRRGPRPSGARAFDVSHAACEMALFVLVTARPTSLTRKYEENLRVLVLPELGGVPISTLTSGDVQRFVDGLAAARTPEHARKALTALRVALRVAIRYGELEANPCAGARVPASADWERPPRILTPEEAAAIIAQAEKDDAEFKRSLGGPLIALAFGSGLRMGELLALRWGQDGLDLDQGLVHVRRSLDRVREVTTDDTPRSHRSRGRREEPFHCRPRTLPAFDAMDFARGRPEDGALLFCGGLTETHFLPFRQQGPSSGLRQASWFAEPLPRFHDTRHAFASHALAAGPHASCRCCPARAHGRRASAAALRTCACRRACPCW